MLGLALLQPIQGLDDRVQRAVQQGRGPALDRVMQAATDLGRRDVLPTMLLAIAVLDPVAGPATARLAIVGLAATNIVVEVLRRVVDRPRPSGEHTPAKASFPSGHAASAACLAWILSRRWPRFAWVAWPVAAAVAWSRIVLNRHYLSDVVAGVAIGLACTWLVLRVPALKATPWRRAREDQPAPAAAGSA